MPWAPKRPCTFPGCGKVTVDGRCELHKREERKFIDARRGSAFSRGYDARWQAARAEYLLKHPLCKACHGLGRLTPATVVDHVIPHNGNKQFFWDQTNWQALCKSCHDSKTAREGRWGKREVAV